MTTQHPAPPADTEYPADTAVVARRAVGLIVDVAVLTAVGYVVAALLELAFDDPAYGGMSPTGHILAIVLGVGLWLAAFVGVPVSTGGQTLGMRLTGVRVVRADGNAASGVDHLVRMVCLIVDGLLAGLVGLGVILASQRRQRIGDMAAGTLVVPELTATRPATIPPGSEGVAVSDVAVPSAGGRRRAWARRPAVLRDVRPVDVAVALAFGVWGAGLVLLFPATRHPLVATGPVGKLACVVALTAILVLRRAHPVVMVVLTAAVSLLAPGNWFVFAAIYAAGAHLRRRVHLFWVVPLLFAASFVAERGWVGFRVNDNAFLLFMSMLVSLAGLYVGTRRELIVAAHERADRAEREQALLAEAARAEERARLAGEMHDVVTHRVNLMVLQAGALAATSTDPAVHRGADDLRRSGRAALAELRDLVGVLRAGGERTGGSPTEADPSTSPSIASLVDESRRVGVAVTLDEDGDSSALTPTVARTLVRVVQEALSNARKHAAGATVRVEVRHGVDGVGVAVVDTGGEPDPDLATTGGGAGLTGLRQRVEMVGGSWHAGPEPNGGFAVRVRLPAFVPTAEREA